MSRFLLRNLWFLVILASCAPSSRNASSKNIQNHPAASPAFGSDMVPDLGVQHMNPQAGVIDSAKALKDDSLAFTKPLSLMDLPTTEHGDIVLSPGYYEASFKSYCLQPGTPSPGNRDAYLQAPLNSYRKDIVETILRRSLQKPELEQKNIQLLLWSVVSGSNYNKLNWDVQSTASQLLSRKQIFELKGGVVGVMKSVSSVIPDNGSNSVFHTMNQLFDLGTSSYEAYERIAVPREPSVITNPDYKMNQWNQQADGYYVRYFPDSYKQVKVQVYVPKGLVDSTGKKDGYYVLFDPVNMMAIPANSNSQRLGIGAPMVKIIRKVIEMEQEHEHEQRPPSNPNPPPTNPKPVLKSTKPVLQKP